jgi:hypothetical protein
MELYNSMVWELFQAIEYVLDILYSWREKDYIFLRR